jgi:hypothetical protein
MTSAASPRAVLAVGGPAESRRGAVVEVLAALALFAVVALVSWAAQKPISLNEGKGWDGIEYYAMAEQIAAGRPLEARAPQVYRPGVPLLVALLPGGTSVRKFEAVNLFAAGLVVALFVIWLRLFVGKWWVRALLVLLLVTMWHWWARYVFFHPVHADPWFLVCLLAGLIVVHQLGRDLMDSGLIAALSAITFAGVLFREAALVLPVALLARDVVRPRARKLAVDLVPLAAGAAAVWLVRWPGGPFAAHQSHPYDFADVAVIWLYQKPFPTYVHAWFIAFGPVLVPAIFFARDALRFLGRYPYMSVVLGAFAVAGWLGGTDTERLLYWSFPVVYAALGVAIEQNVRILASIPLIAVLAAAQAIAQRLFWTLPDYPGDYFRAPVLLTPLGSTFPHLDLYSWHPPREVSAVSLAQYLALALLLAGWLAYRRAQMSRAAGG